ncbi:MAG TPA: alpha/beta hydrolase [Ferruginibacter sp.]|nr:alpha/beta hydrolase [Ferruginibacter sp.]HRE64580.1 alpha/beta hydrolase [Ferruginibacter sp.]
MKAYFISGLAADYRVFKHIVLPDGFDIVFLNWITPHKNESLAGYALRLSQKIDTEEPFVIVGLSMGGMMAVEISKILKPVTTILVSSTPVHNDLPQIFKLAYYSRLHKLVPIVFLKKMSLLKRDLIPDTKENKIILKQVIKDSDPQFIRWAMQAILTWKTKEKPSHYWHIHGSKDEILPIRNTRPTHIIHGGNHLMIMNRAGEINGMLKDILKRYHT